MADKSLSARAVEWLNTNLPPWIFDGTEPIVQSLVTFVETGAGVYVPAATPAQDGDFSECSECHHVFSPSELAREDAAVWGHPCFGVPSSKRKKVCESYRSPVKVGAPAETRPQPTNGVDGYHIPNVGGPLDVAAETRQPPAEKVERMAELFATEFITGHYRPFKDEDERRRMEQLKVVMLAFFAQAKRLASRPHGQPSHEWTTSTDKNKCDICGDGPFGRHRFQEPRK